MLSKVLQSVSKNNKLLMNISNSSVQRCSFRFSSFKKGSDKEQKQNDKKVQDMQTQESFLEREQTYTSQQEQDGDQQQHINSDTTQNQNNFSSIDAQINEILVKDRKYQLTNLRDLYLFTNPQKRPQLLKIVNQKYVDQIVKIFIDQGRYYLKVNNYKQAILLFKVIGWYGQNIFEKCQQICPLFDKFLQNDLLQSAQPLTFISLSKLYIDHFVKLKSGKKYMETANKINSYILQNQDKLPNDGIISHYLRSKQMFNLSPNDIKLNLDEPTAKKIKLQVELNKCGEHELSRQLNEQREGKDLDIPSLFLILYNNLSTDKIDLLGTLEIIKEKKLFKFSNKSELMHTFMSISQIFKYFSIYFEKEKKLQAVKNIGQSTIKKTDFTCVTNCIEVQPIYLNLGYSQYQKKCLKTLIEITKLFLASIKESGFESNLTVSRTQLFYQISKLQMECDEEIVEMSLDNFKNFYTSIREDQIINAYCTISNYYQYKPNQSTIESILYEIEPKILKQLKQQQNDLFNLSYMAYMCSKNLNREELVSKILQTFENTIDANHYQCQNFVLALSFLENISFSNTQARLILQKFFIKINMDNLKEISFLYLNQIDIKNIKSGLIHCKKENSMTNGLIINWIERNIKTMEIKDITLCLHLINKKQNGVIVESLKKIFIKSDKNKYLLIEYRRNNLMDEELLQSVEQHVLRQIESKRVSFAVVIDYFYNITRLRFANQQLLDKIQTFLPHSFNELKFEDFVKLINSQMSQQVDETQMATSINDLISRISNQKIVLSKEQYQQKKLFYIYLIQIQSSYPGIKINSQEIQLFMDEMNKDLESSMIIPDEDQDDNDEGILELVQKEDSPYEKYISQALIERNIPFIREHTIGFFKIDYFLPQQNTCIELNGDLHYFNDKPTPPTLHKLKYLESRKCKVVTVRGTEWKEQHTLGFTYGSVLAWLDAIIQNKQL